MLTLNIHYLRKFSCQPEKTMLRNLMNYTKTCQTWSSQSSSRHLNTSCPHFNFGHSNTNNRGSTGRTPFSSPQEGHFNYKPLLTNFKNKLFGFPSDMSYFVIGISGVTCGGKTCLTKLLQRTFPWAYVIHQDHYFRDDDWPQHVRVPEADNHVNYEVFNALDMEKMCKDVQCILDAPPQLKSPSRTSPSSACKSEDIAVGDKAETPNFDDSFLLQVSDLDVDVSKYSQVPILIIEGFTIFASKYLYDQCDARFFFSLDKETCRTRRALRYYYPPDSPTYFEKVIWPEYEKHLENFISSQPGITVFDGCSSIEGIWRNCVQTATCRMEEKLGDKIVDKRKAAT